MLFRSLLTIEEGSFHFQIALPKDVMIQHAPAVDLCNGGEQLHITCGPDFSLFVSHNRNETNDQGIFEYQVLDNEDQSCVYKRILPDGSHYDYGLNHQVMHEGKLYVFQSDPTGEFDLTAALRMKLAAESVKL